MRPKHRSPLPAVVWAALVAAALLSPSDLTPGGSAWGRWLAEHGGDKAVHGALFFGQALWLARALGSGTGSARPRWLAAGLSALYGALLELLQLAVPGRAFEVGDLLANAAGALLYPLIGLLSTRR